MNLYNRKRLTNLENELIVAKRKNGGDREFWMDMYTLLYLKWINQEEPTV